MNALVAISEARALLGELRRQQVMDVVRGAAFIGALLLAWISLKPFVDLGNQGLRDPTSGNETLTYAVFGAFAVLMLLLALRNDFVGLATLVSPGWVLLVGAILVSVMLSTEPATSVKRLVLTACVAVVAATLTLLPKTQSELARWLSVAALVLLAVCYFGVLFAPYFSIHQVTDTQEPHLAGDWRGCFGHKNEAAAVMAMLLFVGIYAMRSGARLAGAAILALASVFLLNSAGKTSTALILVVLALSSLTTVIRSFWLRAIMLLAPLLLLNLLGIGTVLSEHLAEAAKLLPLDTSFTGRTDIWTFAVEALHSKLWTGYGFEAFWGSGSIQNLPQGMEWAEYASHSHNGYLDTTLSMGLPGLAALIVVLVIAPMRNFHVAECGGNDGALSMLLLRIWLFGIYLSALESFFLDRADPIWFTFLFAVFGLHYLARFRARV
jgi:O-antigen ligase